MSRAVLCLIFLLLAQSCAYAETRALLIGVSDYDETLGLADLRGPSNDVRLMNKTLTGLGVKNITMLADNVPGASRPTRDAIKRAFDKLATTVRQGDLVIIQFSGHGTRQRDVNGDESDGVDEVFLPADTLPAQAGVGLVRNAIIDDEFGAWTSRIRQAGADVWLIIDTCHAGTGLRNPSKLMASRYVAPEILGASASPRVLEKETEPPAFESQPASPDAGGIIAFYSARANEIARELNFGALASSDTKPGPWYGLFTARLAHRLQSLSGQTYRQLFQAVLADLNAMPLPNIARTQTPSWEGTMPDRVVLGHKDNSNAVQYVVTADGIDAGTIHGLTVGSLMDLFADPAAPDSAVVGRGQIVEVSGRRARFRAVANDCDIANAGQLCSAVPGNLKQVRFARVRKLAPSTQVRFSALRIFPSEDTAAADIKAAVETELQNAVSRLNKERRTNIALGAGQADVQVGLRDGVLWFGGTVDIKGRPAGLRWQPGSDDLSRLLVRIYRAEMLAKQLAAVSDEGSVLDPNPVEVAGKAQPSNSALLKAPGQKSDPIAECQAIMRAKNGYGVAQSIESSATLKQCDRLHFAARGLLPGARDINRVYIDAKYCISNSYRRVADDRRLIPIGDDMVSCSDCPDGYNAGRERVFVLVSEVAPNRAPLNLTGLFNDCSAPGPTRSGRSSIDPLWRLIQRNRQMRSAFSDAVAPTVWVNAFEWLVMPRTVALGTTIKGLSPSRSLDRNQVQ